MRDRLDGRPQRLWRPQGIVSLRGSELTYDWLSQKHFLVTSTPPGAGSVSAAFLPFGRTWMYVVSDAGGRSRALPVAISRRTPPIEEGPRTAQPQSGSRRTVDRASPRRVWLGDRGRFGTIRRRFKRPSKSESSQASKTSSLMHKCREGHRLEHHAIGPNWDGFVLLDAEPRVFSSRPFAFVPRMARMFFVPPPLSLPCPRVLPRPRSPRASVRRTVLASRGCLARMRPQGHVLEASQGRL